MNKTLKLLIIGAIMLVLSFLIDRPLFEFTDLIKNSMLTYIFSWTSYILSLVFVLLIMSSLFLWEEKKQDWIIPLWFSSFASLVVSYVIKFTVMRERPVPVEYFGIIDYSFPSAHAAFCFAAVPILDRNFPMLKWFWLLFAVLVAISRLYLEVHYLSDVIAGALIGYAIGKGVIHFKKKYSIFG